MIEKLLRNYHIKNTIAIGFVLLVLFSSIINSYNTYQENKQILYSNIDKNLKSTALNSKLFLNDSFHDRAINKDSITIDEDNKNISILSDFIHNLDVEYLYTMVKRGNKIYFTSSSAIADEINTNSMTRYFDYYEDATGVLLNILEKGEITYEESTDKWGTFRTVFIPLKTAKGTPYIVGADIKIDFIEQKLNQYIKNIITTQIIIIIILIILGYFFLQISRRELNEIQALKDDLDREIIEKTKELEELNNTLEDKIVMEIDKNRKKDKQILHQSKMAQMGEMIGSIAHQWRQPLNEISTGIQNLKYDYKEGLLVDEKYIKAFIDKNKKTIAFMSRTIDDFRDFFRVDKEKKEFNVSDAIQSIINMQSAQLANYNIKLKFSPKEFNYVGFESEFQQVILNIINNAKDALVENKIINPLITIEIEDNTITIADNAGGIPSSVLDRIFEPYFTTKEQGKGTGMGLYMSKMIIEDNMGGKIVVTNKHGGAMFIIKLGKKNV